MRIELPLSEPILRAYNYLGYPSSVFSENPSLKNRYLNEVFVLRCTKRFLTGEYSSPQFNVMGGNLRNDPNLEKVIYPMRFAKGYIHYIIKELIDSGYYVCFGGIDDYYMEEKSWYGKRHFSHDGMIFGYDTEKKTYMILAYDIDWRFRPIEIAKSSFEKGRKSMFAQCEYGNIIGIKPKKNLVEFEPSVMLEKLEEYLMPRTELFPGTNYEMEVGISSQDYLVRYLDKLYEGAIEYEMTDYRVFRTLWEHKVLMLERIKLVETVLGLDDSISMGYAPLEDSANRMRMLYASHIAKRRDSGMRKMLIKLIDTERALLTQLAEKMRAALESNEERTA